MKVRGSFIVPLATAAAFAAGATLAHAQTSNPPLTISGGLGNFDCYNRTCEPVDQLDIDLDGVLPTDIVGYWSSYRYGYPTLTPTATGVRVTYGGPGRGTVPIDSFEHFGVHFRYYFPTPATSSIHYTWSHNGVPMACGYQPVAPMPVIYVPPLPTPTSPPVIVQQIENPEPVPIWIQRRAVALPASVALDELMSNSTKVRSAPQVDPAPIKIEPGELASFTSEDAGEGTGFVIAYDIFANVRTVVNGRTVDAPGALVSTMMAATNATRTHPCNGTPPQITSQPTSRSAHEGDLTAGFHFTVFRKKGTPEPTYIWAKDGVALVEDAHFTGVTTKDFTINSIVPSDNGVYTCTLTNACGSVITNAATLIVTPNHVEVPCHMDWNDDGSVNPDDLGDYITGYFDNPPVPGTDFNQDHSINPDDIGDFITAYFAGHC